MNSEIRGTEIVSRLLHVLLALTLSAPLPANAFWLWAREATDAGTRYSLGEWKIRDGFLTTDENGFPTLDFHEDRDPHNRRLLEMLNAGMDIYDPKIRREIAKELTNFSDYCDMDQLGMNLRASPIPEISNAQINVPDPRRLTLFSIVGCLDKTPKECKYSSTDAEDTGLDFVALVRHIQDCRGAVAYAISQGAPGKGVKAKKTPKNSKRTKPDKSE